MWHISSEKLEVQGLSDIITESPHEEIISVNF
jgi:hypothetical protein